MDGENFDGNVTQSMSADIPDSRVCGDCRRTGRVRVVSRTSTVRYGDCRRLKSKHHRTSRMHSCIAIFNNILPPPPPSSLLQIDMNKPGQRLSAGEHKNRSRKTSKVMSQLANNGGRPSSSVGNCDRNPCRMECEAQPIRTRCIFV